MVVSLAVGLVLVGFTLFGVFSVQRSTRRGPAQSPVWLADALRTVRTGAIVILCLVGIGLFWQRGLDAYDSVYSRALTWRQDQAVLRAAEQQHKLNDIRPIYPDDKGRLPLLYGTNGILRDPNNLRAFTLKCVIEQFPYLEDIDARIRAVVGAGGWPTPATAQAMLLEQATAGPLPTMVPLSGLLAGHAPSYHRLILGVAQDDTGQRQEVVADMADLVHIAVGGSSGWGKSVFLRSLGFQLAKSTDPVDLAMIDLEGATLAPFATCDRLLWPIGDSGQDATCILRELAQEVDRRKELFAKYPGVDSLARYNEQANGHGGLDPIVCLIDEATALLDDKAIESQLKTLTLRARKYGIWCILAGQDWKASSLDTAIRNQLSTRVQFKAMSDTQSRVLLQRRGAEEIDVHGRALAWIPGRDLITLQAPHIGHGAILAALANGHGPQADIPQEGQTEQQRILDLAGQGLSNRQIELNVYGYTGGTATRKVKEALEGATTVVDLPQEGATTAQRQSTTVVGEG